MATSNDRDMTPHRATELVPDNAIIHWYPFPPWRLHGGTMRIRTAMEAPEVVDRSVFFWWDADHNRWSGPHRPELVGTADPAPEGTPHNSATSSLKRRAFPSTLFESGRAAATEAAGLMRRISREQQSAAFVLHTSYLAPALQLIDAESIPVFVDLHDLVWLVHQEDAVGAPIAARAARRIYAASVKRREMAALSRAHGILAAGWNDAQVVRDTLGSSSVTWAPTGLDRTDVALPGAPPWRVGVIGNFEHSATQSAARQLLASPLAHAEEIEIVLAGLHSQNFAPGASAKVLGPVHELRDFYGEIHATVLPVTNGSGMKCKLGEAALAGRLVITTAAGAHGYPPELSKAFEVVDDVVELTPAAIAEQLRTVDAAGIASSFNRLVGRQAAAELYARAITGTR